MPFIDLDGKNDVKTEKGFLQGSETTDSSTMVGSKVESNSGQDSKQAEEKQKQTIPSKDPESVSGGLLQEAYENGDKQSIPEVQEKVEDNGIRVISRPLASNENAAAEKATKQAAKEEVLEPDDSSTPYPALDSVKQAEEVEKINEAATSLPPIPAKVEDQTHEQKFETRKAAKEVAAPEKEKLPPIKTKKIETDIVDPNTVTIDKYMDIAIEKNASDVHFTSRYPVYFRFDGRLQKYGVDPLEAKQIEALVLPLLNEKQKSDFEKKIEIDMMYQHISGNRFRVNVYRERSDIAAAFRLIPKTVRTIDELGLPTILKEFSKIPYGLLVVTGPTGSGKSTTIAAMVEEINRTDPRHIVTIEDPVEYIYEQRLALIAQRNMYEDTQSWANALRSVLRQDPNVVVIGEMRDYETIASALTIAETGHLVFATLHTNSAAQTIDRIIDVFPEGQQNQVRSQLSNMLSGVISQRLIPLKDGGRKAAMELLIGTVAIKNAIREGKTHQIDNIIQTSADVGMVSLEKSLVELIRAGLIDIESAKSFTIKPDEIDLLMR